VFGVPSFVLDGELFWGREHLPEIRDMLGASA
jgi:2-hydroxychromene-2-carboxylate isomerase